LEFFSYSQKNYSFIQHIQRFFLLKCLKDWKIYWQSRLRYSIILLCDFLYIGTPHIHFLNVRISTSLIWKFVILFYIWKGICKWLLWLL
jgi:hypothetical protein